MKLSPILDVEFEECSFAYRKNRSVQKAIYKIIELRDKGENMFLIVTYDVSDDKRREKIAVQLHNFGQRVQKSVFECYLNKEQLDELKSRLEKIMDFAEDSIRYYYLCKIY